MLILGIESSCDETGASIVKDGRYLLSDVVASQIEIHNRYGGVVPEVASRQQLIAILPVIETALEQAGCGWEDIDAIAATYGPGLAGSLLVGLTVGKTLALAYNLPFWASITWKRISMPTGCAVRARPARVQPMRQRGNFSLAIPPFPRSA